MSFECDLCGKEGVVRPGEWCSECAQKEFLLECEQEEKWFAKTRLCQQCGNADIDFCYHYRMPFYMCKRKFKCKHFKEDSMEGHS